MSEDHGGRYLNTDEVEVVEVTDEDISQIL